MAVCDKRKSIDMGQLPYKLISPSSELSKYEKIIVTSDVYYEEIRIELIRDWGIKEDDIVSIDEIEGHIVYEKLNGKMFAEMKGLEIGDHQIFSETYTIKYAHVMV